MSLQWYDFVGLAGVGFVLVSFFLLQAGKLSAVTPQRAAPGQHSASPISPGCVASTSSRLVRYASRPRLTR